MTTATVKYTIEFIRERIETSDEWLLRGLLRLHDLHVFGAVSGGRSGFGNFDQNFLISIATQVREGPLGLPGQTLSAKQIASTRKLMRKYAGQLTKVANGELVARASFSNPL